ncbi:alpha/beta fold hydrolase [Ohtaekwangia koreensis]|uniref:Pimeloyl-ACP methyl ester carboxylesterase n=1 Tax=Ohtaekwangia koreensis TaxID=688867 RepID=A0A1T5IR70_9BACT|nr:alpha/beta hydrolase [Ohtaekwangia koreensis]SKC41660.1 Pimeloyl-ACP methyl ester carboxylesterase [Ohtaekwangia koreensis]
MASVLHKTISVDGIKIFYREAGSPFNPLILLLHGFPSSSHMYRDLMYDLADDYHLIAPDYPAFGNSDMPDRNIYSYTFDNLSMTIEKFIDALKLSKFSIYMQDYGSPVGYRIAVRRPAQIQALIIQNANAYEEGLGPAIEDGKRFWANRNEETENAMRGILTIEGTKMQYMDGVESPEKISPDAYLYDQLFLDREGNKKIQLDLLYDYRNNITLYPVWQKYLRDHQPPALITWGKNDALFTDKGAVAYKKDLPDAEIHLLNTGHFALEEFHAEIAAHIDDFLKRVLPQ